MVWTEEMQPQFGPQTNPKSVFARFFRLKMMRKKKKNQPSIFVLRRLEKYSSPVSVAQVSKTTCWCLLYFNKTQPFSKGTPLCSSLCVCQCVSTCILAADYTRMSTVTDTRWVWMISNCPSISKTVELTHTDSFGCKDRHSEKESMQRYLLELFSQLHYQQEAPSWLSCVFSLGNRLSFWLTVDFSDK